MQSCALCNDHCTRCENVRQTSSSAFTYEMLRANAHRPFGSDSIEMGGVGNGVGH